MEAYNKVIKEQRANGIIEEAPPIPQGTVNYLPHHSVVKPSKTTTKIRIVYDASAKASKHSLSLNDCLHRGPIFLSDFVGITIRLRLPKVALVSDIEKAFLQVGLQEDDRDVTRFLWLKDPSKPPSPSNIVTYRFCRVPSGVISSPFLLAVTIAHHLRSINNPARSSIHNNVYVDNVFHGTQTDQQAFAYYTEAKRAFANASMNLREWHSNSKQFMDQIQQQARGKTTDTSVLGLRWNLMEDTLQVNGVKPLDPSTAITKRRILEVVASVFDPCGFFSPVLITGKLLLQQLWREKVAWDEQVSEEMFNLWKPLADDLACIPACKLPRQLSSSVYREKAECELHCFCDASANAYSAVIYLSIQSGDKVTADLIFSKSRSVPIQPKKLTIPRIELMAVLIGTRVLKYVATELRIQINAQYIWTDSCCVLHWILGDQVKTIFVQNRLKEIRKNVQLQFRFVPSTENPADMPSRGVRLTTLKDASLWWHGPEWLNMATSWWPSNPAALRQESFITDELPDVTVAPTVASADTQADEKLCAIEQFSTLRKLYRVTAYVFRFAYPRRACGIAGRQITAAEMAFAKLFWERRIQRRSFPFTFEKNGSPKKNKYAKTSVYSWIHKIPFVVVADISALKYKPNNSIRSYCQKTTTLRHLSSKSAIQGYERRSEAYTC